MNGATMAKAKKVSKSQAIAQVVGGVPVTMMLDPKSIKMDLAKNRQSGLDDESIGNLANNIKAHGLLQPVMVNKVGDEFWCVFGHRRTLAAIQAELATIPAMVREDMSPKDIEAAKTIENEHQENTSPIDKANSIVRLKQVGFNQNEIAEMMEAYPADISRLLSLLKLPAELQDKVHRNQVSVKDALSLVPAAKAEQKEVISKIEEVVAPLVAEGASDAAIKRATAEVVQKQNAKPDTTTKPVRPAKAPATPKGNINDVVPPLKQEHVPTPAPKKGKDEPSEVSPVQKNLKMYEDLLDLLCKLEDATEGNTKKIFTKILDMVDGSATAEDVLDLVG